jgi:hypothetical protein
MNVKNNSQQLAISIQPKAQKQFFTAEVAKDAKEKLGYFAKIIVIRILTCRTERFSAFSAV